MQSKSKYIFELLQDHNNVIPRSLRNTRPIYRALVRGLRHLKIKTYLFIRFIKRIMTFQLVSNDGKAVQSLHFGSFDL